MGNDTKVVVHEDMDSGTGMGKGTVVPTHRYPLSSLNIIMEHAQQGLCQKIQVLL